MKPTSSALIGGVVIIAFFAACAHAGLPLQSGPLPTLRSAESIIQHGAFREYTLPASTAPGDVAAFNGAVYFPNCGVNAQVDRLATSGAVNAFTPPIPLTYSGSYGAPRSRCISTADSTNVWYVAGAIYEQPTQGRPYIAASKEWLVGLNATGAFTMLQIYSAIHCCYFGLPPVAGLTTGPDGRIWYLIFSHRVIGASPAGAPGTSVTLPGTFQGVWVTPGCVYPCASTADHNLYVLATGSGAMAVFKITTAGVITHQFALPSGAGAQAMAMARDGYLWIVETGLNKIARMQPNTGALTQISVASSGGLRRITAASDGALWFTDAVANRIGRMTTAGAVTKYSLPAGAAPNAITACPAGECGLYGGVWFTETGLGRIGRYDFP